MDAKENIDAAIVEAAKLVGLKLSKIADGFYSLRHEIPTYRMIFWSAFDGGKFEVKVKGKRLRTLGRYKRLDRAIAKLVEQCSYDPENDSLIRRVCIKCKTQVYRDGACDCGIVHPHMTWNQIQLFQ